MDSAEEDISARVLLRKVLHTELPSSPVTRSSSLRRSMRLKNTPGLEDPGSALRHRLKKKLRESVSASPLPSPKRRRSAVAKTAPVVASPSLLYDEDMTSRGLLRGIIQMETEASLLMSGQPAVQEAEPNPAESSAGERTEGLSAVELSDLTLNTEPLTHVVRGLSRRKPQTVFSVSAFERDLDQLSDKAADVSHASHRGDGPQEKPDTSHDSDLSAGSKSGLNLTLKTPFVDRRSERPGLQRKVSNRRVPSVDAFDEAVQRCLEQDPNQDHSVVQDGKTLEDSSWQKFTLGLNDATELYIHPKKDDTVRLPPSQEDEDVVPSSQEAGDDASLSPKDDLVLAPMQATTESLPESQDVELQDPVSFVEVEDGNVEEDEDRNVEDGNVEEVEGENVEEVEDGNVEEVDGENVEEDEDRNVEDGNVEEVDGENVEEVEDGNMEEVEDGNVEEVEDGNVEDRNMEEVEDGNVEDGNMEEVEDGNVEDGNVEDGNVEEVEDGNMEEVEDGNVKDGNMEEVEDGNVEDGNVEEVEDENIEENPDTSHKLERTTRRAHRSEGGAVLRVPASTRVTKSFGAGLNPREKDLLDLIDGNIESLQDVPDESEQAGSPVAEVTTPGRRSSQHEARLSEEDLPALAEYHDDPEEVSQSEEEELMDAETANQSPEHPQEEDEDEEDDLPSAELSMKTPAFIRQKRVFASSSAQATPTVLKEVNAGPARKVSQRAPRQKRQTSDDVLPKSYVMSVFRHFAKTKVASDVYPVINEFLKKYFDRLADDLEVYATHAKRKTIEVEDFVLLMRRQGFVTDSTPVNILIEKYLPLEYRKLLIPVATSGNKVIPAQRR